MEESGAATRGPEDHAADAPRLRGAKDALSAVASPEHAIATEVCGAPEARLSAEVDHEEGGDFAGGLVAPVEAVSASTEGRKFQIGQGEGSSLEQRVTDVEEEEGGSLAPAPCSTAEPGGLRTCHEANGGLSHEALCASKDTGCVYGMLEETAEGSQFQQEVGNRGDWGGEVQGVKATVEDLHTAWDEAERDYAGLLGSTSHGSGQEPCAVDAIGSAMDANDELQQDALMPDIETEVSRPAHEDSVPSVSGGIDLSLDGKTGQFGAISGDSMGHVPDLADMATEGCPCQQGTLAGGKGVTSGVLEYLQTCYKEPHFGNEGLPCSTGATCLKKNSNHDLRKDGFSPKVGADNSWILHEDSVPSISGSSPAVSLDGKAVQIGELSEHRSRMENVVCSSEVRGTFSCESTFHKDDAPGDEGRFSGRKVNTNEDDLRTDWREATHDNGDLSDPGKHHSQKLLCGADDLPLITGANHELEKVGFLPNINAVASCPVDETSVPSVYGSSIDVALDAKVGQAIDTSANSAGFAKLVCGSLEGGMTLCDNGLWTEAYGDENQHSGPCADKELQQTSLKYGISELSPEENLCVSSYDQPCDDGPYCSGKESSALCHGHQNSAVGGSGHLDQRLVACNCTDDSSFLSNANDGESQSQKLTALNAFRRRNPKRAASSRRDSERPDQINQASSGTRKPKKVDIASSLQQSTSTLFPNKIAKGRSGMNRSPKPSTWGSLKELLDGFCQSCQPSTSNSHSTCLDKGRSDNRSDQKSQPSIRKSRSSRSSKRKCSSLSFTGYAASEWNGQSTLSTVVDIGHAASDLNGQPAFPTVADTNVSFESHRQKIPKLSSDTSINIFDSTSNTAESTDSYCTVKSKCTQTDVQQLERALVSSTKETCASSTKETCADVHVECAKLSTSEPSLTNANGSVMLHVGFSPDSVLEVASVTCEGNASASHDVMLHENSTDTGALNVGGYHPSILSASNFGKEQDLLSLMNSEQQAKTTLHEDTRKEEIGPSHAIVDNVVGEGKAHALQKSIAPRKISIARKPGCKKKDESKRKRKKVVGSTKISPCEPSKLRPFSSDSISPVPSESILRTGPTEFSCCFEDLTSGTQDRAICEHDTIQSHSVTDGDRGSAFDSTKSPRRRKKDDNERKKGKARDTNKKGKSKKKKVADDTSLDHGPSNLPSSDLASSRMNELSNLDPASEFALKNSDAISTDLPVNVACKTDGASVPPPPPRAAWVCCDDCQKWRCIPAELADVLGETRWTCKDNGDKAFANCSIPQEKTNAEINAELDLSDASADEADDDRSNSKACKAPSWTAIRSNLFMHRQRRTQSIDESMVCNCKPPQDGRLGCRDGCLNRMLNIECVKRTCPCGEQCSNQKFQRRSYAKLRWFHSGQKGYGLQLQEDVAEGRFLIEYVGEVLDITSYEDRQRYYASRGQKHFYFMALNGGEVIDACTKGNLGRFINHSCSPNCRTEKWMVNGEVCIGIFAMRNIKKGEELTFDYNYVRVSGAAPQKCFCGTAKCRGYIGGDISVVDTITQDDPEAGHFEQMVLDKDSDGSHPSIAEPEISIPGEDLHDFSGAKAGLEPHDETGGTLVETSEPENSLEAWSPQEDEDVIRTPVHVSQTFESSLQQFPVHGPQSSDPLQKVANSTEGSKAPNVINGSAPSLSDSRSNLVPGFNANKINNLKQHRNVKPQSSSPIDNEHILGVEGRLNNLLDRDGGISKRKDATNGYLKLLVLTAAEGDSAGGTSKSVRDLSLILDALLKTKSHSVLLDIISKNGLHLLHNILKQNKTKFHRTPIIRKLLKVLEFLAQKGILTSEHINGGPRCAGFESFRDSMLSLVRHQNFQVQKIARSFRDTWILNTNARSEPTEYPHTSTFARDIQGTNMFWSSARRKRKSRWDYQPAEHYKMAGLKIQKVCSGHGGFGVQFGFTRNNLQRNQGTISSYNDIQGIASSTEGADDEVPPGFEPQQECQPALSIGSVVAPGLCMERYQPSLSVSYGVPVNLVQHFGTPESEGDQCHKKWKVAPGVPFSPFPPLPPYPREGPCPSTASSHMFQHDGTSPVNHNSSGHCGRTAGWGGRVHKTWRNQNGPRKWPHHHQGRKFSSNNHRFERFEPSRPQ